jgi:DNA repair protein RadA/Sms
VASAAKRTALTGEGGRPLACFGELGLTGELRTVAHADRRLIEARRFGLDPVIEPESVKTLRAALGRALTPAGKAVARAA